VGFVEQVRSFVEASSNSSEQERTVFFRDDDGGWANEALARLMQLFSERGIPLDIAVIPATLNEEVGSFLNQLYHQSGGLCRFHQHGFEHRNKEPEGRACEFGPATDHAQQMAAIDDGRQMLIKYLEESLGEIFTPPWNRCSQITMDVLEELGFECLSRDSTAKPLLSPTVVELPVTIDWFKKERGRRMNEAEFSRYFMSALRERSQIGIMLHHEHMQQYDLDRLSELLTILLEAPAIRILPMRECFR